MKAKLFSLFLVLGSIFTDCVSHKFEFDYPANLEDSRKKEFKDFIVKGEKLYQLNCSKCHGSVYKSSDGGVQFTDTQLRNYAVQIKIKNETHKFARQMTKDDIDAVCVYLKYRKN